MTMTKFAKHVLAVAKQNETNLSVLALQKVMYFTLGEYMRDNSSDAVERIYTTPFEAWDYGPVNRDVYREHRYGWLAEEFEAEYEDFNNYIVEQLNRSPFEMVEDSHNRPFWRDRKEGILNRTAKYSYSLEDLKNDFA